MPAHSEANKKGVPFANTHPTFTKRNPSDCASLQIFRKIQKDPERGLRCGILDRRKGESQMDNISIILMLAGFVLSFCCAINAIRGKPNKKTWYWMIAAYIGFGVCYAASQRDARNIGIAFMLICFCYIVKVVWGFLKAAIKHEKYHCKKDLLVLIAVFVLFIVGMMLPYDKAAAAQRAAESEVREIEKAASSAAAASSKAEAERQKQAESEAASDSKKAEDERNAAIKAESERLAAEMANSKKEEPASNEQSASEKAKEEERNAAIRAESEKIATSSKAAAEKKTSSASTSTVELSEDEYKVKCAEVDYKDLCRYPERYSHKKIKVKAKIQQVMDASLFNSSKTYRVQTDTSGYGWYLDDEYFVTDKRTSGSVKLLEDDVIVIYGEFSGMEKVTRALTWTTDEVPGIQMKYAELVKE